MFRQIDRLRRGQRWWPAEFVLRGLGVVLLYVSGRLAMLVERMVVAPPLHEPTPSAFAVCAAAFVLLSGGLALTLVGPVLLRHVPVPRRALL